jgi:hypothetical protein
MGERRDGRMANGEWRMVKTALIPFAIRLSLIRVDPASRKVSHRCHDSAALDEVRPLAAQLGSNASVGARV